jgi:hypothetical protein
VGIPAETTLDMVALHRPVTGNDVLDGGCQQVTVVRGAGREGRAIVEGVGLLLRRQFELPLESIDLLDLGVSHDSSSVQVRVEMSVRSTGRGCAPPPWES